MKSLSERLTETLTTDCKISSQQKTIYTFGLHQLGVTVLNLVVALFLAALFGMVIQMIIFLIAYIPLRQVAGGYHAKTEARCFLSSFIMEVAALFVIRSSSSFTVACTIALFATGLFISYIAPVDTPNNRLDNAERCVYRQRTILLVIFSWAVATVSVAAGAPKIMATISTAHVFLAIILGLGWVKNRIVDGASCKT